MGLFGSHTRIGSSAASSYEIERSLRFNDDDSAKLSRTFGTNSSNTTKTLSFWMKRGSLGTYQVPFSTTTDSYVEGKLRINNDDTLQYEDRDASAGTTDARLITNQKFRDNSAWYHIVLTIDTTNGTAGDRVRIYVNGVRDTSSAHTNPASSYAVSFFRSSVDNWIGVESSSSNFFDGYLAEIHFIDGTALDASSFGETDADTGQWIPKKYGGGGYGTNGFYLDFSDNSGTTATTLGKDSSGQGNNWTPNNFSVAAGDGNDSVIDTPTNNYCVLNPLSQYDISAGASTYTNGNLDCVLATQSNSKGKTASTFEISSGKWYWECKYVARSAASGNHLGVGLANADSPIPMREGKAWYYYGNTQRQYYNDAGSVTEDTTMGVAVEPGDMFSVALDLDNGKWYVGKNNTWINSGNPVSGSGSVWDNVTGTVIPTFSNTTGGGTQTISVNFGQKGFAYTPPTGFKALCTANLSEPTIPKSDDQFKTVLYTGNATARTIDSDFATGFVWIKRRSGTGGSGSASDAHVLANSTVGANSFLMSNSSAVQNTASNCVTAFNSTGVTVGTQGIVNDNSQTFVSWHWKESATAGFDVVTYSGDGNTTHNISHNLGVVPDVFIVKSRTNAQDWYVMHTDSGANKYLVLSGNGAQGTSTVLWGNTLPTSSVFTVGENGGGWATNESGEDYVAYLWAGVKGYSKVGTYKGNGQADGSFIYTGFKPAWLMIRRTNDTGGWEIVDHKRDPYNEMDRYLYANNDYAEYYDEALRWDFLSNGFKMRTTNVWGNADGSTYLYIAFAGRPFKYANAR